MEVGGEEIGGLGAGLAYVEVGVAFEALAEGFYEQVQAGGLLGKGVLYEVVCA